MTRLFLVAASVAALAGGQSPARPLPTADGDLSFTLRIAGGSRPFRSGERIPVELVFSSPTKDRYAVDGATYDRGGRLTIDDWEVEPFEGVSDPLLDYFAAAGGQMGGARGIGRLGEQPFVVSLDLNEWVRFDRPGTYTLRARTQRVTDEQRTFDPPFGNVNVYSAPLAIEILPPDPAWEAREVASAIAIIDGVPAQRREACRTLRFLGTPEAVEAMIPRLDVVECSGELRLGVAGASDREHAVRAMEAGLRAPAQPVTPNYLRTLAILSLYLQDPSLRVRRTPDTLGRVVHGELRGRSEMIAAVADRYRAELMAALPEKTPRARAVTLAALHDEMRSRNWGQAASADQESLRRQLVTGFLHLDAERQRQFLEYQWSLFSEPQMLPALRRLATGDAPLADLALRRLHDLAPDEARPLILREIADPRPGTTMDTLGVLPDRELPQFDAVLVGRIVDGGTALDARLLERYASDAVAADVAAIVGAGVGRIPCEQQAVLLAYLRRAAPQEGEELLARAIATRGPTRCYQMTLGAVARLRMTPGLERLALAHLEEDDDPTVVVDAAETLGKYGSPAAQAPLRARFQRWSQAWAGRAEDLRFSHARENPHVAQAMLERALLHALGQGHGWLMDDLALRELATLCVTDSCLAEAGRMADAARDRRIRLHQSDGPIPWSIHLAQYQMRSLEELEHRLGLFSAGTSFTMDASGASPDTIRSAVARIVAFGAARGLEIREVRAGRPA